MARPRHAGFDTQVSTRREAPQWATFTDTNMAKGKRVMATGKSTLGFGDLLDEYWAAHRTRSEGLRRLGLPCHAAG